MGFTFTVKKGLS